MTAGGWLDWAITCLWIAFVGVPLGDAAGRAIGRLAVNLVKAAEYRRSRRERFSALQCEFALARLQRTGWPSAAERAQMRASADISRRRMTLLARQYDRHGGPDARALDRARYGSVRLGPP